ncbi:CHAT domain-containing protein [Collybia nuda]|uniref:CHAT domain-containing protein n=1 Tax=Collybia nuda TaxID=64659 RepID=A0A9P5Y5C0_9AGAR|nr:CHAT domain-containing protein [Collybia nuda]
MPQRFVRYAAQCIRNRLPLSRRQHHGLAAHAMVRHNPSKPPKLETSELGVRSRLPPDSNSRPEPENPPEMSDQEWEIRTAMSSLLNTGRAIYVLQNTLPDFFHTGLVTSIDKSTGSPQPASSMPMINANPLDYQTFNDDTESIYSPKIRLSYTPPVALPSPFPQTLHVEGIPLYMASTVFIRHTLNALYSNLNVTLQKLIVKTPGSHPPTDIDSKASTSQESEPQLHRHKYKKRLSREKSLLIKLCVTGTARVTKAPGEWEVNSTYTFSPTTGLIQKHTINSIYPAPHQAVYDALRLSLGKVFGLGVEGGGGARTNGHFLSVAYQTNIKVQVSPSTIYNQIVIHLRTDPQPSAVWANQMDVDENTHAVENGETDFGVDDDGSLTTDSDVSMEQDDDASLGDIDKKIALLKRQIPSSVPHSTEPGRLQYELGECYTERYEKSDEIEDVELALSYYNSAVNLAPHELTYLLALGLSYETRFQITRDTEDIKSALQFMHATVDATPISNPDLPARQQALAASYRSLFQRTGEVGAVRSAIEWDQKAIDTIPPGHLEVPDHYQSLALSYMVKYERFGDTIDLDHSVRYNRTAVSKISANHSQPAGFHDSLAEAYRERFRRLGDPSDIESALHHNRIAVSAGAENPTDLAEFQMSLAVSHRDQFQALGNVEDLEAALENDHAAVAATPKGGPKLPYYWQSLAASYLEKSKAFNDLDALQFALEYNKKAAAKVPEGDEDYSEFQAQLGVAYLYQFETTEKLEYLTWATNCFSEARRTTPPRHCDLANHHQHLGICHLFMFQLLGKTSDLELSMECIKLALEGTPPGHPDHPDVLKNLALIYQSQYQITGDIKDLQYSFDYARGALEVVSSRSPEIPGLQLDLARAHTLHFQRFGKKKDLVCALELIKMAIKVTSPKHAEYPILLNALAETFKELFTITGDLENIETSINHYYAALKTDRTPPVIASCERGLSIALCHHFAKLNDLNDIQDALEYATSAINATHDKSPIICDQQYGLAVIYNQCYDRFRNPEDLEAAIKYGLAAVNNAAPRNPALQTFQRGLATSYTNRFLKDNNPNDLEMALHYDKIAMEGTPENHYNFSLHLQSLGTSYTNKFMVSKDINDLKNALNYKHAAIKSGQNDLLDFAALQSSLAFSYLDQFYKENNPEDLHCALFYLRNSATAPATRRPQDQWDTACHWASNAFYHQLPECVEAFSVAFQLLPDLLWIGNAVSTRHSSLLYFDIPTVTMWAVSACIKFNKIVLGIELLEQGLAITHQQQLQLKGEFGMLLDAHPAIAEELKEISHQIQLGPESGDTPSIHTLALRRNNIIKQIRALSGFETFLLPTQFQTLVSAAKNGPVILLNCTTVNADAIIMLPNSEYMCIALPSVTKSGAEIQLKLMRNNLKKIGIHARDSQNTTENPWYLMTLPLGCGTMLFSLVFKALHSKNIMKGRIWWCPTGPFTYLPLHAAPSLQEDVFEHSYTPTLMALVKANEKYAAQTLTRNNTTLTFVGLPELPGGNFRPLPSVPLELVQISSAVGVERVRSIVGGAATVDAVTSALASSQWLHLACHGEQDGVEPLESHLVLYDGGLKLEKIFDTYIPDAQFVFLSACETAMGDAGLINESMHLTGGMIFAGFCGAAGTMWSIADPDGPPLSGIVYKRAFGKERDKAPDVRGVARALHMVVRAMRRKGLPFQRWAPFVHMGI